MAIQGVDFLQVAQKVCTQDGNATEAEARTAQGRAYYAAYLTIRDRLASLGFRQAPGDRPHQWLLQKLRTARDDELQDIGKRLSGLLKIREIADYDLQKSIESPHAGVRTAVQARLLLNDFLIIPDKRVKTAIRP